MLNVKSLSLIVQNLLPKFKLYASRQTNRTEADGPNYLIVGYKDSV